MFKGRLRFDANHRASSHSPIRQSSINMNSGFDIGSPKRSQTNHPETTISSMPCLSMLRFRYPIGSANSILRKTAILIHVATKRIVRTSALPTPTITNKLAGIGAPPCKREEMAMNANSSVTETNT